MTSRDVPESDWRRFRRLREVALDRFCERILDEVSAIRDDSLRTPHERYLAIYELVQKRDSDIGRAFNDPRRSTMVLQLIGMDDSELLEPDELGGFTSDTREAIERARAIRDK
jgi:hypothetical protein